MKVLLVTHLSNDGSGFEDTVYGPFETYTEAYEWGDVNISKLYTNFEIYELEEPYVSTE